MVLNVIESIAVERSGMNNINRDVMINFYCQTWVITMSRFEKSKWINSLAVVMLPLNIQVSLNPLVTIEGIFAS